MKNYEDQPEKDRFGEVEEEHVAKLTYFVNMFHEGSIFGRVVVQREKLYNEKNFGLT